MTISTLKLGRKEFVVISKRDFKRMAAKLMEDEENAEDVRLAKAALAEYRRTGKSITLEDLERELKG